VASREAAIEALTGAHAGRVLSCEIIATGGSADVIHQGGRQYRRVCYCKHPQGSAQSETPGIHGKTPRPRTGRPRGRPSRKPAARRLEKAMSAVSFARREFI
jgi:hypothetical protein